MVDMMATTTYGAMDELASNCEKCFGGQFKVTEHEFNFMVVGVNIPKLLDIGYNIPFALGTAPSTNWNDLPEFIEEVEWEIDHIIRLNKDEQYAAKTIFRRGFEYEHILNPSERLKKLYAMRWRI